MLGYTEGFADGLAGLPNLHLDNAEYTEGHDDGDQDLRQGKYEQEEFEREMDDYCRG